MRWHLAKAPHPPPVPVNLRRVLKVGQQQRQLPLRICARRQHNLPPVPRKPGVIPVALLFPCQTRADRRPSRIVITRRCPSQVIARVKLSRPVHRNRCPAQIADHQRRRRDRLRRQSGEREKESYQPSRDARHQPAARSAIHRDWNHSNRCRPRCMGAHRRCELVRDDADRSRT